MDAVYLPITVERSIYRLCATEDSKRAILSRRTGILSRYFGHHTRWYAFCYTTCACFFRSAIPHVTPHPSYGIAIST